jgi:YbbR domain-containing protein
VSVEPRTEGRLPRDLRDREVKATPDAVQVLIWRSYKSTATKIYTETVDLSRLTTGSEPKVKLVVPQYMRLESDQPAEVTVKLEVAGNDKGAGSDPVGSS